MRIGIVSDTHMSSSTAQLPQALREGLAGVELILHLGDFMSPQVVELLERIAPMEGVAGNNDGDEILQRFGRKKIIEAAGIRIGMIHGDGPGSKATERRAAEAFFQDDVQVILFGHSHAPYEKLLENGILLFNPGSPWDKRRQPRYSYGILTIENGIPRADHYYFDDRG